jgi:predicted membrane protein
MDDFFNNMISVLKVLIPIALVTIFIIILISTLKKRKKEKQKSNLKQKFESLLETEKENNSKWLNILQELDVSFDKIYALSDEYSAGYENEYKRLIVIDNHKNKLCFKIYIL